MQDANALPIEMNLCHAMIREQASIIDQILQSQQELKRENEELRVAMQKLLIGHRREMFINPNQGLLQFGEDPELQEALEQAKLEAAKVVETIIVTRNKTNKEKPKRSEAFPIHLRREVVELPIPAEQQKLLDEGKMAFIRHEIREMLKFKRPEVFVIQYKQAVLAYVNEPEKGIFTVERPLAIGDEGRYDATIGATIVTNKFGYHLPFYRMQDMFASSGWTPSRSSIDHITTGVDFLLEPLVLLMKNRILEGLVIGMDDTNVTLLIPPAIPTAEPDDVMTLRLLEKMEEAVKAKKKSIDAKMWVYTGMFDQPYDVFDFRVSRHRDGPSEFLGDYQGNVMADCYSGNLSVMLDPKSVMIRMACWSHARRKLFEARENDPNASVLPLALMSQLYDIERRAVDWSDEQRTQIRQKESIMILDRLRTWIDGPIAASLLPQSALAKSVNYLRNHWEALKVFAQDGRLPIDNNATERLMKRVATGRKNWQFIGSIRAGIRNARLMSLVSSAHRHDLDVEMYLVDVMTQVLNGSTAYESMLPDVWKEAHPEAVRTYRAEERRDKADRAKFQAAFRRQLAPS